MKHKKHVVHVALMVLIIVAGLCGFIAEISAVKLAVFNVGVNIAWLYSDYI